MANRFPLTLNTSDSTIEELPSGVNLDLSGSNISNVANIAAGNSVSANYFVGNLYGTANLATYATTANAVAGANVSGQVSYAAVANSVAGANVSGTVSSATTATSATTAGTVTTAAQGNITSVGTLTGLTVNGTTNLGAVGNVKITGGSANQLIQTDGAGNLSFATVSGDSYMLYPVKAGTIDAITLSGTQTIDGVALSVGDRVLVWKQATASENGIYVVQSGSWTRATDFTTGSNTLRGGVSLVINQGAYLANVSFICTNTTAITIGSTAITFERLTNTGFISIWSSTGAFQNKATGSVNSGATAIGVGTIAATDSVAVGYTAISQGSGGVAFGYAASAGTLGSGTAIGTTAIVAGSAGTALGRNTYAAANTVSVGYSANANADGGIAIGYSSRAQGNNTIRIGPMAGGTVAPGATIGNSAIAIGTTAGYNGQALNGIAIGESAAEQLQLANAIAIGYKAGFSTQGSNSIAMGWGAGYLNQGNNSIILNATGANLNQTTANTFTVKPVRAVTSITGLKQLYYDPSTGEIVYYNI